ncbi:hypothetical protein A6R68_07576, partial [Neotoma lepida]
MSLDGNPKPIHGPSERSDGLQWSAGQPCNQSKPKAKTSPVKSNAPAAHLEIKPDELAKKRGPNIEKSVKDLQRCTVSLTRYRVMIKEEVDSSVKKIKAAFAELHNWSSEMSDPLPSSSHGIHGTLTRIIIDKEVSLMAEMDKVKEEATLSNGSSGSSALGAAPETKPFFVAVTHPKNNYSSRTPCSSLLPLLNTHAVTSGKQGNFARKSSNHNKPSEGKAANPKMNGPSSQRRRFNPQYHNRLNGPAKSQGGGNEADPTVKSNNRHEHRRQPHNGFRPKNK